METIAGTPLFYVAVWGLIFIIVLQLLFINALRKDNKKGAMEIAEIQEEIQSKKKLYKLELLLFKANRLLDDLQHLHNQIKAKRHGLHK